jgi:hypothetical protein
MSSGVYNMAISHEGMPAAHEVDGPLFAHAILTTKELLAQLSTA